MVQDISIQDYTYILPEERIAKYPLPQRDSSRLLLYNQGAISETRFTNLPELLPPRALLLRNNSKVIHARLLFQRPTGAQVEVFCLEPLSPNSYELSLQAREHCTWLCMTGNARRWKVGSEALVRELSSPELGTLRLSAERLSHEAVRFSWDNPHFSFAEILELMGILPIPPYLNRESEASDDETYQTVYAQREGSVAAPTAGLHFTPEVFATLRAKGIEVADVTLHVGAGTFRPVKAERIGEHEMHREFISVDKALIQKLAQGEPTIIAVGTTTVRTLESLYHLACTIASHDDIAPEDLQVEQWQAYDAEIPELKEPFAILLNYMERHKLERLQFATAILIAPGYRFRVVQGLITNFHQPHSTLLLLIAAFVGEPWRAIYDYALREGFRFLSYGDSSLLLPHSCG